MVTGYAGAASTTVTITADVPSAVAITDGCSAPAAYSLGMVLPGQSQTTTTGASVCRMSFQGASDTSMLRISQKDRLGTAMGSRSGWTLERWGPGIFRSVD